MIPVRYLMAYAAIVALATGCGVQTTATSQSGPTQPVQRGFDVSALNECRTTLGGTAPSPEAHSHEWDACILGMYGREGELKDVTVLRRDGSIWVLEPYPGLADAITAAFGVGDWVVVHQHQHGEGDRIGDLESGNDLRLIRSATDGKAAK